MSAAAVCSWDWGYLFLSALFVYALLFLMVCLWFFVKAARKL